MRLLTIQNCYAVVYYLACLASWVLLQTKWTSDTGFIRSLSELYFHLDILVQLLLDIQQNSLTVTVYLHHALPLVLLSQFRADSVMDTELLTTLLLTEFSSVFLCLKFFIPRGSEVLNLWNNIAFAISFTVTRVVYLNLQLVHFLPHYTSRYIVFGTCTVVFVLNTYWFVLICRKFYNLLSKRGRSFVQ